MKEREAALVGIMSDGVIFCEENSDVWAYLGDANEVSPSPLLWWPLERSLGDIICRPCVGRGLIAEKELCNFTFDCT